MQHGVRQCSFFHYRWLDKLGIAALTPLARVFRQTFIGGYYSLLDNNQYPLPVSLVHFAYFSGHAIANLHEFF